jgi:hypothetical protein
MTDDRIALRELLEKGSDVTFLRELIGFAAQRLMELEVGEVTGAAHGARSPDRLVQRNGYRDRDWQTRAGTVELVGRGASNPQAPAPPSRSALTRTAERWWQHGRSLRWQPGSGGGMQAAASSLGSAAMAGAAAKQLPAFALAEPPLDHADEAWRHAAARPQSLWLVPEAHPHDRDRPGANPVIRTEMPWLLQPFCAARASAVESERKARSRPDFNHMIKPDILLNHCRLWPFKRFVSDFATANS